MVHWELLAKQEQYKMNERKTTPSNEWKERIFQAKTESREAEKGRKKNEWDKNVNEREFCAQHHAVR